MKKYHFTLIALAAGLLALLIYIRLDSLSDAESMALFKEAAPGWGIDAGAYKYIGKRSLPNQPTVRVWSRATADGVEEIEVTESERLICRSVKQVGTSKWINLGCIQQ